MVYSYSRLTSYDQCALQWYFNYVEEFAGMDNFYSLYGSFAHLLLELWGAGKVPPERLVELWDNYYDKRVNETSPELFPWSDKWRAEGQWFFDGFDGFPDEETVWTEKHIKVDFGHFQFQGFVDRLARRGKDLVMVDYKSSKPFAGKDVASKARQMLLYSRAVKEIEGKYPKQLEFLHFRQNRRTVVPFSMKAYNEAKDWASRMVDMIEQEEQWTAEPDHFFCKTLCGFRNICEHGS